MTAARGRVLKAKDVAKATAAVPWEPRAPGDEGPQAEVEVVRERGEIVAIQVRCRCGCRHDIELVAESKGPA